MHIDDIIARLVLHMAQFIQSLFINKPNYDTNNFSVTISTTDINIHTLNITAIYHVSLLQHGQILLAKMKSPRLQETAGLVFA